MKLYDDSIKTAFLRVKMKRNRREGERRGRKQGEGKFEQINSQLVEKIAMKSDTAYAISAFHQTNAISKIMLQNLIARFPMKSITRTDLSLKNSSHREKFWPIEMSFERRSELFMKLFTKISDGRYQLFANIFKRAPKQT